MPLIRGELVRLPKDRHLQLVAELRKAIEEPSPIGPAIFEIPFAGTRYDILVVWEQWEDVQPDERSEVIFEAYSGRSVEIAQAMGVTYQEAMQDHLLPYQIEPRPRPGEVAPAELRAAMLGEGAISVGKERLELRFPTRRMANAAYERLETKAPAGRWSFVVDDANFADHFS